MICGQLEMVAMVRRILVMNFDTVLCNVCVLNGVGDCSWLHVRATNIASYQMASRHTIIERRRRLRLRHALGSTQKYQHELALMVLNYQRA